MKKFFCYTIPAIVILSLLGYMFYRYRQSTAPAQQQEETLPDEPSIQDEIPIPADESILPKDTTMIEEEFVQETASPASVLPIVDLASLSSDALWQGLLQDPKSIEIFVKILDDIANGQRPLDGLWHLRPEGNVTAETNEEGRLVLSATSQNRFNPFIDMFCAMDAVQLAIAYVQNEEKLQAALEGLGYKDKIIRTVLAEAAAVILSAPNADFQPSLEAGAFDGIYYWEDPIIEHLNDAQKLFLRTGPENCKRIRLQLESLAEELKLFSSENQTKKK